MKTTVALFAMTAGLAAIAGLSQVTSAQPAQGESQTAAAARGAKAWADNCASCHNIRSPLEKDDAGWAIAATHMRVRANIPGNVTRDIIAFLQASNEQQRPSAASPAGIAPLGGSAAVAAPLPALKPGDPQHGARLFGETCVACHGPDGKGAIAGVPSLGGPNGRLAKSDEVLLRHIAEGFQSPGSPMPMPARGGNPDLSDQDLADVLAYMRKNFPQ